MNNQPTNNNNNTIFAIAIIGIVLLAALGGGYLLYKSATATNTDKKATKSPRPKTSDDAAAAQLYATAPPGAQPAHLLGSPTSPVTVEEFADFQCPTCGQKYPLAKEIIALYGNRIKFIFRNIPLVQVHPKAYDAAVAAEAAGLQGKFWEMEHQLFTNQREWTVAPDHRKVFEDYAQKIGLNVEQFQNDAAGLNAKSRVDADMQRANALKIQSTPTFLINGVPVAFEQMDINSMQQLIDAELQKTQTNQQNQGNPASGGKSNSDSGAANGNTEKK